MFGLGITEILFILVIALLVLGPEKLPETARQLGRLTAELKRTFEDIRHDVSFRDKQQFNIGRLTSELNLKDCCDDDSDTQDPEKLEPDKPEDG